VEVPGKSLYDHSVLNLVDLHAGITFDQFGENAFVVWSQMLHQDKGHAGGDVCGHAGEEGFKSGQSASRSADADDGERFSGTRRFDWFSRRRGTFGF
jgi:hypothetical protein